MSAVEKAQHEKLCERLDRVLVEVMTTLQELSQLRQQYNAAVREGYITMAQARYAMGGPKLVSSLQYDSKMTPLVSIEVAEELDSYEDVVRKMEESNSSFVEFKLHRIVPGKPVIRSTPITEDADSADKGAFLRQRIKCQDGQSATESEIKPQGVEDVTRMVSSWRLDDKEEGEGTFESREDLKDPLKWFGVLVPQTLRRSQQHFITVIDCSVKLAESQLKLETLRRKYRELLASKKQLKKLEDST